jgi:hypothetical protein
MKMIEGGLELVVHGLEGEVVVRNGEYPQKCEK